MTVATEKEYLTAAETARLIRAQLKREFPGVKFSVRSKSYSMGASINVSWTDGPSKPRVEQVTSGFEGGGFDGMIDLAYSVSSWLLPDGSATWARSPGTEGSMGMHQAYDYPPPTPGARLVHFGADSVFLERSYSLGVYTAAAERVARQRGLPVPEILTYTWGEPYVARTTDPEWWAACNAYPAEVIHRELYEQSF